MKTLAGLTALAIVLIGSAVLTHTQGAPWRTHSGQVDLDVAAIVAGMTRAHGAQEVASLPKWWRDVLSQP